MAAANFQIPSSGFNVYNFNGRDYTVGVPSGSGPFPAVINLHGSETSTPALNVLEQEFEGSDLHEAFICIEPIGSQDQNGVWGWNHSPLTSGPNAGQMKFGTQIFTTDDKAFLEDIITALQTFPLVDPNRIYVMGHSAGGLMTMRLGIENQSIQGISPSGAAFFPESSSIPKDHASLSIDLNSPDPVPASLENVVYVQGLCDDKALFFGRNPNNASNFPSTRCADRGTEEMESVLVTASDWAQAMNCSQLTSPASTEITYTLNDGTSFDYSIYFSGIWDGFIADLTRYEYYNEIRDQQGAITDRELRRVELWVVRDAPHSGKFLRDFGLDFRLARLLSQ